MFEARSAEIEKLDEADFSQMDACDSFKFIASVNRWFGGVRIVKNYLLTQIAQLRRGKELKILDIGCGICDIPLTLDRYFRDHGYDIAWDGLESNRHVAYLAIKNVLDEPATHVRVLHKNIFQFRPDYMYDFAIASMFFHHFNDHDIKHLIEQVRTFTRYGLLINDLHRSSAAWLGARFLTSLSAQVVRHDACLSVQRGFRVAELNQMLRDLNITQFRVYRAPFARVIAEIAFKRGG